MQYNNLHLTISKIPVYCTELKIHTRETIPNYGACFILWPPLHGYKTLILLCTFMGGVGREGIICRRNRYNISPPFLELLLPASFLLFRVSLSQKSTILTYCGYSTPFSDSNPNPPLFGTQKIILFDKGFF